MQKRPRIKYDTDTANKYWDDPNYRIFCIKQEDDGTLCYVSSNDTNNRLKKHLIRIGVNIQEFTSPHLVDTIYVNYHNLISQQGTLTYISLLPDGNHWETTIEAKGNYLYAIGTKIEDTARKDKPVKVAEPLNCYSVEEDLFFCAIISKHNNSYTIDSLDGSSTTKDILQMLVGHDINILLKTSRYFTEPEIIEKSMAENKIIHYYETVNSAHFSVTVIPLVSVGKVILKATSIDTTHFGHIPKRKAKKTRFFPFCIISKNEVGAFELVDHNSLFEKVVLSRGISLSEITDSVAFQSSQATLAHTFSTLQKQQEGNLLTLFLEYIPTIFQGSQLATLCYFSREQDLDKLEHLRSFLSKRESEIFSFVIEGYSNPEISSLLNISTGTVKKLVFNCFKKLGISTRFELVDFIYSD